MRKIPMKFSDTDFGTDEYGYIPTMPGEDPDDADMRYTKHLRDQGVRGRVDAMGNVVVESSAHATWAINKEMGTTMRITESQLRRIIRQEARALREGGMSAKFKAELAKAETAAAGDPDFLEVVNMAAAALKKGTSPAAVLRAVQSATWVDDGRGGVDMSMDVIRALKKRDMQAGQMLEDALDTQY